MDEQPRPAEPPEEQLSEMAQLEDQADESRMDKQSQVLDALLAERQATQQQPQAPPEATGQ